MRWTIAIVMFLVIEIYAYQALKTAFKFNWISKIYLLINFFVISILLYRILYIEYNSLSYSDQFYDYLSIPIAMVITLTAFKLIICLQLIIEDLFRLIMFCVNTLNSNETDSWSLKRRSFVSKIGLFIASLPIPFVMYGIFKGRFDFRVIRYEIEFDDLPKEFDGYRLTHISDIHAGSLSNEKKIKYAIDLINNEGSELVLFTGDFVNSKSRELIKWKDLFSKIKSKDGKFSILGNHDYGDYVDWGSEDLKKNNFQNLLEIQKQMGFNVLLNENCKIQKGQSKIFIIGVENWGKGGFRKSADVEKACLGINNSDFKIMMTHDPSHWDLKLRDHKINFNLTLSGHTHGMQFGIEIPGWVKWSPVQWVYKHWAGLYYEKDQYINVNRGFGVLAFPGRVGISPEISVIKLKKT